MRDNKLYRARLKRLNTAREEEAQALVRYKANPCQVTEEELNYYAAVAVLARKVGAWRAGKK